MRPRALRGAEAAGRSGDAGAEGCREHRRGGAPRAAGRGGGMLGGCCGILGAVAGVPRALRAPDALADAGKLLTDEHVEDATAAERGL